MISRRHDILRLAALLPLLLIAAIGRQGLSIDVENRAMKSVGTPAAEGAALRAAEFGDDPVLILLASPRAPTYLNDADLEEVHAWIAGLEQRPEVVELRELPTPNPGEHCLAVTLRLDEHGRYADSVDSFSAAARASSPPVFSLAITGLPAVEVAIARELGVERERVLPIIIVTLALVLLLIYRSPVLVLGALVAPLLAVFLLEGLQGLLGLPVDPISALLGPAVLTTGVASSVHILERYLRELRDEPSVVIASHSAAHALRKPFLLTATTTVAGFLGLLASPIPAVQRFGLFASVGIVLALGLSFLGLPSLLRLLHRSAPSLEATTRRSALRHAKWVSVRALTTVVASAFLAGLAVTALDDMRVENDPLHVLAADQPVRRDTEEVSERLGGSRVFELMLAPAPRAMGALQVATLVARVAALDGVVGPAGIPRSSENGYRLLPFLLRPGGSGSHAEVFSAAERAAHGLGWPDAQATGLAVLMARDSNALVVGQRTGIIATSIGLWLVMAIGFRSWRLGLLGLVPNLLPLVLINGTLAFAGRPLTVASSMIGTVMLGLVVDDTIHFLHAYRRSSGGILRRLTRTLFDVRRPIMITTLVLCVGFSATFFGKLQPTLEFGVLAVATLVIALLADLWLLPALLVSRSRTPRRRGTGSEMDLLTE